MKYRKDNWTARLEYRCWGCGLGMKVGQFERPPHSWCSQQCKDYVRDLSIRCRNERFASSEMRALILKRDHFRCTYCKRVITDATANIEHVKPWHAGRADGSLKPRRLVPRLQQGQVRDCWAPEGCRGARTRRRHAHAGWTGVAGMGERAHLRFSMSW